MKKIFVLAAFACASLGALEQKVGIVNFNSCITDSKLGKQEHNAFETVRKQFASLIEDTDKQLREISDKLQDKDHLDGLSKEAEESMKTKFAQLNDELSRYQQQYYQYMNQQQYKIMQTVTSGINHAAEQMASVKNYNVILNKEACFFYSPALDITAEVIKEMNKNFDDEAKKQAVAPSKAEEKGKK
jgi:Skp family chaperone for outer membrane proteins